VTNKTDIEWTDLTWNPVTGCTKVSPGCDFCYAERLSNRFRRGFDLKLQPNRIEDPLRIKKPRVIFVNSMSDLYHPGIPEEYIAQVFDTMRRAHWHTFQALTKRGTRMAKVMRKIEVPPNVWLGVSVETQDYVSRIDDLRKVETPNRFLSCEPLLGPLSLDLTGIAWVIGGGESGPHLARQPERRLDQHPEWIRGLRDQCEAAQVPFHFKQWGGHQKKKAGRVLDGRTHDHVPGRLLSEPAPEVESARKLRLPTVTEYDLKPTNDRPKNPVMVEAGKKAAITRKANLALKAQINEI
jgi:protein gp37